MNTTPESLPVVTILIATFNSEKILPRTLERDPLIPLLKARKLPFVAIGQPEDDEILSVDHD